MHAVPPPLIAVTPDDGVLGPVDKLDCHREGILHRAFSVFLYDSAGNVLLQQRSAAKPLWPGWWANSCCSHPAWGEPLAAAVQRRVREELGVTLATPARHCFHFVYHARYLDLGAEHELCHVFAATLPGVRPRIVPNPEEVAAVAWRTPVEVDQLLANPDAPYSPWLRLEWPRLRGEAA